LYKEPSIYLVKLSIPSGFLFFVIGKSCIFAQCDNKYKDKEMEKFSELIRIRRSMRKFTEEELNQDEVVALLRAALISPSGRGQ
jgi:hypothetical protein